MTVELSEQEIEILLESLKHSLKRIRDAQETPDTVRQNNLTRLEEVALKLRLAKKIPSFR